ncbi:HlyD family efflux transporter periplasmic adaptor subunit [Roseateles sp. DB2]|uniref:HlyD family efflux transporter periplasmic adaptor subunit n=1 Tax=Roseateles sp. DB2 TaxID=3453717 RepID=UPI003EE9D74D
MKKNASVLRNNLLGLLVLMTLTVLLGWWAAVAEIVQSSHAAGLVIASARTQVVQVAMDGVVQAVLVQEGQKVRQGEVLARLDRGQAEAAFRDSQAKVAALKAALARLHAEVLGQPLVLPREVLAYPNFAANQTELFRRRQGAVNGDIAAMQRSLALAEQELALSRPLLASGDIGQAEVIRLERVVADLSGQITARRSRYFQDAQAEMTKAEEDLATQEQVLAERAAGLDRTEVRAPADGLVKNIQTTTPGAKVRPGDVILELVPTASELIVEAKLRPADIAQMRVGLPTSIKLDAYDYSVFGSLHGRVKYISPDVLTERMSQGESIYYRIQIAIDSAKLEAYNQAHPDRRIDIQPGMTCVVDIVTGHRTVLSYLTKPITKVLHESLHER